MQRTPIPDMPGVSRTNAPRFVMLYKGWQLGVDGQPTPNVRRLPVSKHLTNGEGVGHWLARGWRPLEEVPRDRDGQYIVPDGITENLLEEQRRAAAGIEALRRLHSVEDDSHDTEQQDDRGDSGRSGEDVPRPRKRAPRRGTRSTKAGGNKGRATRRPKTGRGS